jgi:SAM-dependent methyltransferase
MKIKLVVHDLPDKEYITIDPAPMDGPAFTGDVLTLEGVCDKADCTVLLADEFLDYIPAPALEKAIQSWCELLRHGGRIILGGTNLNDLARKWLSRSIDVGALNQAIYGNPVRKAGLHSLEQVEKVLVGNGIKITRKTILDGRFVIEGVRP